MSNSIRETLSKNILADGFEPILDLDKSHKSWIVDKVTGAVYKPAGWKAPAKHIRFNLSDDLDRAKLHDPNFVGWAGGYLYLR